MPSCISLWHAKHFSLVCILEFSPLPRDEQVAKQLPGDYGKARIRIHAQLHFCRACQTLQSFPSLLGDYQLAKTLPEDYAMARVRIHAQLDFGRACQKLQT